MMMKAIKSLVLLILISASGFAQTNKELIKMGDASMQHGQYSNAVHYYSYVLHKIETAGNDALYYPYDITTTYDEPDKNEDGTIKPPEKPSDKEIKLIHKLADAYRLADDYKNAEIWYTSAIEYPNNEFPYARYFYGVSLMYNSKFEEAMVEFEAFQITNPDQDNKYFKLSDSKTASCQFALNPTNTKQDITLTEMDSLINSGSTSFGLQFTSTDYLLFSSARTEARDSADTGDRNPLEYYLLDIYMVKVNEDGTRGEPEKFPFEINSADYHEGSAVISADGNTMFLTKMDPAHRNDTKIWCSRQFNNTWLAPFELDENVNMDGFRSMNPHMAADNTTMYFASDRPGGEGGMDIWMTTIGPTGATTPAQNIGSMVNTAEEEITPFYHSNTKTLYFSSGGHIGFGGKDIFASKWNPDSDWFGASVNMGAPINSSRDDTYFVMDDDLRQGFVTSDRQSCEDCDSIYNLSIHCNKIYEIQRPEMKFKISGYVYDVATNEIIPGATVAFKDVSYQWDHFDLTADENGYYEHELISNLELFMRASKTDYFADKALVYTLGQTESVDFTQDFYLEKIPKGEITIEGIEYDFNKATLRPISIEILKTLIEFLELNNNLKIEIRSHTDWRGSDSYNLDLSDRRAKSVVDYLVDNGIPRERLVAKGYGETKPAEVPDGDGNIVTLTREYIGSQPGEQKQDELHQRNRRTAFFVLEQN